MGPAHVGVKENEVDDKLVKEALKHHDIDIRVKLSKAEVKGINEAEGKKQWQMKCENKTKGRHLHNIQGKVRIINKNM